MNLFRRKQPDDVPYWAGEMKADDFRQFMESVERSIRKHNIVPIMNPDKGIWHPKDKPKQEMGLHNLVQMCASRVPLEWPAIIDDFMRVTLSLDTSKLKTDFESAKTHIKLRLLPLDTHMNFEMAEFPISDQFHTVVVIDGENAVTIPKKDVIDEWPVAMSQVYDLALQNIYEQDLPAIKPWDERMPGLLEFEGRSFFVASNILLLDRHFPDAKHGVLVIAPARDIAFVYEIKNMEVTKIIGIMMRLADDIYRQSPGPVTPCLFWWRDDKLTNLPWEPMGDQVSFTPPPEFVDMLNGLGK